MSFETRKFNISLPENGGVSIMLIGASRAGKSCLMKYLYDKKIVSIFRGYAAKRSG
jgi:alpha-D-ribose 1-methylphosphonate 5-triphosphate synthase subunit PhnL